ncbi:uncharacterized protein BJX67DRAFT_367388 [Aspergillus lucknowensis]|uniref:Uncharacterized protein n=1 Tax=Aspergillus lucknowensis TaxID=176173 RepID=A0ABR4L964_9EURO
MKEAYSTPLASTLQNKQVRKQFPQLSTDQLFQATYDHVHNRPDHATCDQSQLVDCPGRVKKSLISTIAWSRLEIR